MTGATARPGGRTARVRSAVLRAAEDALIENGLAGLDLADVGRRAEVGKTTMYRRWGTIPALVTDLLDDMAAQSEPRADTGSLRDDLRANARLVQRTLTDARQGPLFKAILAAALTDADASAALSRFYQTRIAEWAGCVDAAKHRGEIPDDVEGSEVIKAVSAPLYYRLLIGEPIDAEAAEKAADDAYLLIAVRYHL